MYMCFCYSYVLIIMCSKESLNVLHDIGVHSFLHIERQPTTNKSYFSCDNIQVSKHGTRRGTSETIVIWQSLCTPCTEALASWCRKVLLIYDY